VIKWIAIWFLGGSALALGLSWAIRKINGPECIECGRMLLCGEVVLCDDCAAWDEGVREIVSSWEGEK
jgi:hypothetical protein